MVKVVSRPESPPRPELATARRRLKLTQAEAADAVGVTTVTWGRWERGEQAIRSKSRAKIARLFDIGRGEVDRWIDGEHTEPDKWSKEGNSPEPAPWPVDDPYTSLADTVKTCGELWRRDLDPARRDALTALPFAPAVLGEWLVSLQHDPHDRTRAHEGPGPSVGMPDVRRVQEATRTFDAMDRQFGGGLVRPAVVDYLDTQVAPLLLNGRYTDEVGGRLAGAAALLTALAGWEAFDIGAHGLAQTYYGQALRLAKAAGDDLTAARVLSVLAQLAIDRRNPRWAVRLTSAAHQAGRRAQAPPRVIAMLLLRRATAAALGVARGGTADAHGAATAHRLVAAAESALDRAGPQDDEPSWIAYFTAAELSAQAGCCWQLMGEHARAADCAERAVHGLGARFTRAVQFNQVHLAGALLGLGELDRALDAAKAAVPLANTVTSHRSRQLLQAFDAQLAPHAAERRVRDWREYVHAELRPTAS